MERPGIAGLFYGSLETRNRLQREISRGLATVLASQVISCLVVFVVLVPIADFSRRV
jgi:hypothetical protein